MHRLNLEQYQKLYQFYQGGIFVFPMCYLNPTVPCYRAAMPQGSPFSGTTPSPAPFPGPMTGGFNVPSQPSDFEKAPGSPTELDTDYTQGYLKTQIGKRIRVTFLIGTNLVQDREGVLVKVGISYIILKDADVLTLCDIYAIKFVNIYQS